MIDYSAYDHDPATSYDDRMKTAIHWHNKFLENLSIAQLDWYVENYSDPVIEVDAKGDIIPR